MILNSGVIVIYLPGISCINSVCKIEDVNPWMFECSHILDEGMYSKKLQCLSDGFPTKFNIYKGDAMSTKLHCGPLVRVCHHLSSHSDIYVAYVTRNLRRRSLRIYNYKT